MMKFKFVPVAAAVALIGGSASADPFVDAVVKNFQDLGYSFVEVERGPSQISFEGVRGTEELEVIYDTATGQIIKQETGRADPEYLGRTGVEIGSSDENFVGNDDDDDDDDRSGRDRDDDDEDDDDDRSGRDRDDDDDDDNSGSGSGRDDDDRDDDNSGSGSDDDDDDDDSGSDDSGSDDSGSDDSDDDNDDD
jgi:hypothetical protein